MQLFHGSIEIVENPKILEPGRMMDYGTGFYTTASREQADKWALRKLAAADKKRGFTNIYSFDEGGFARLKVLRFESPDERWLDFVMANRMDRNFRHDYDIVFGPVANDRVYAAFALYEDGLLDKHGLIRELRAYKLSDQMLFHTESALGYLRFEGAEELAA